MFLKRLPGISYLPHEGYSSGGFWHGGCPGALCPDTWKMTTVGIKTCKREKHTFLL